MLKKFFLLIIDSWKFFVFLILFSNFIFLLNADLVLITVLVCLFCFILVFSSSEFKQFIKKEKLDILKKFFLIINDIKNNYFFLSKFYSFNLFLFIFFTNSLNFWFANNVLYRCLEFSKNINYFFIYLYELLFFIFYSQNNNFSIEEFKQNFFLY